MRFRCVLAGCAAAAAMLASAPEPAGAVTPPAAEPANHAPVCDLYGAGFLRIPGTRTCLGIRGYLRFDTGFLLGAQRGYTTLSRFVPKVDARTETEWGTLRSYAEIEFDSVSGAAPIARMLDAYVELAGLNGTLRLGKSATPYARFLDHGGLTLIDPGGYPYFNTTGISYAFEGPGGFSAIAAALDGHGEWRGGAAGWGPLLEAGATLERDWGKIGAVVAHDGLTGDWAATAAFIGRFGRGSVKLQGFYSSHTAAGPVASAYSIWGPSGVLSRWSILGSVSMEIGPKVGAALTAQWYDTAGDWLVQGELQFAPVQELRIVPAIRYTSPAGGTWASLLRFERYF